MPKEHYLLRILETDHKIANNAKYISCNEKY